LPAFASAVAICSPAGDENELGTPVKERVSGSDFFPRFYEKYKDDPGVTVFICGGRPGVAEIARLECLYRVLREPRQRWRRYFVNQPPVLNLLVRQKMGVYKDPFDTERNR